MKNYLKIHDCGVRTQRKGTADCGGVTPNQNTFGLTEKSNQIAEKPETDVRVPAKNKPKLEYRQIAGIKIKTLTIISTLFMRDFRHDLKFAFQTVSYYYY